eukprot:GHVL01036425.1.p1 GENE.GHVL01036425.1~~GHVL01036425.1.p1  ORF type:complete len:118 (-),score=17.48 GHVL01036425.1:81-434(-)
MSQQQVTPAQSSMYSPQPLATPAEAYYDAPYGLETHMAELIRTPECAAMNIGACNHQKQHVMPNGQVYRLSRFGCGALCVPGYEAELRQLINQGSLNQTVIPVQNREVYSPIQNKLY